MSGSSSTPNCTSTNLFDCGAGAADANHGETVSALATAIVSSFGSAGAQLFVFLLLRLRLSRIYRPRSYLVPERERVPVPPGGVVAWLAPLFTTPNLAFIQKCGLDAYFFLRYLRMLLKIFLPLAIVLLPILLPINRSSGNVESGLDRLSVSNIAPRYIYTRLWAHLILALCVIAWVCYVVLTELKGYIRVRQAFLSSPQHRIRASATTVLVTGIPKKWLTVEALLGLYDVYPGGIRNIWINRNYDELSTKVSYRDSLAVSLENAETNLIRKCWQKHEKAENERLKQAGQAKKSRKERKQERENADAAAERMAQGEGVSAGDQHDNPHGLQEALKDADAEERRRQQHEATIHRVANPLDLVEDRLEAVGKGLGHFGRNVGNIGHKVVGDVGHTIDATNKVSGFTTEDALYAAPDLGQDAPPTPPPKVPGQSTLRAADAQRFDGAGATVDRSTASRRSAPAAHPAGWAANSYPTSGLAQLSDHRVAGPSIESSRAPKSPFQIEIPADHGAPKKTAFWKFWKRGDPSLELLSPQPHTAAESEFPLTKSTARVSADDNPAEPKVESSWTNKLMFWKSATHADAKEKPKYEYPKSVNAEEDEDQKGHPVWSRYITAKERETMRVPIFSPTWCPSLPLIGKKVDRIYWTRRELARMNAEIEADQNDIEKFPHMNSAFIQFNHQVAAHMACQSVSHHVPLQMAPRTVEISPDDVLWGNMSITWWERYLRSVVVLIINAALIILYAIPVSFTSLLSKVDYLAQKYSWLAWLATLPRVVIGIIQGVMPAIILSIILVLVPIIFRLLVTEQGVATGTNREVYVQKWYFTFLFIQVFLIVTITSGLTKLVLRISKNPTEILNLLADDLPSGADYFFSYLTVQAMSNSASALLQVYSLLQWFVFAPLFDSTARAKWQRQTSLSSFQWGSFFPPFTNFAVIGIIYSVIAPLILVFMLIIFGTFWIVYRYNVLYVYQFRSDTGGLLFPIAVNQLFVGLYVLELFLVGLFFTKRNEHGNIVCIPQGIIMIIALVCTVAYQILLNDAFRPLLRYLPITLEDEAVIRDEEFARAQASRFGHTEADNESAHDGKGFTDHATLDGDDDDNNSDPVKDDAQGSSLQAKDPRIHPQGSKTSLTGDYLSVDATRIRRESAASVGSAAGRSPWHHRHSNTDLKSASETWKTDRWRQTPNNAINKVRNLANATGSAVTPSALRRRSEPKPSQRDIEAQHSVGDVLFSGFADELEDLTPDERDLLVRYAFQHSALRAKRPVVWIPRDRLGVSDDEIKRAKEMSTVTVPDPAHEHHEQDSTTEKQAGMVEKTNIWMSNEGTALDGKGKVVFRRSPPDFSNVDLIAL